MIRFECIALKEGRPCGEIRSRRAPPASCPDKNLCVWRSIETDDAAAGAPPASPNSPPTDPVPPPAAPSRMRARCEAESVDLERATVIGRNGDVFVARLRQDLGVSRLHCRLVPPEASRGWRLEVVSQAGCRLDDRALAAGAVVDLAGEQLLALGSDCRIRLSLLDEASESSDEEADDDDDDGVLERLLSRKSR